MFCQCNASTIYTVFYNYVTHIKQVVKQPIDTSLWTKLQAKKHRASTIFKRDMLAQSLGEYTVKNCLSTLCIHFIPWIQPQLTVHHFLSVGSNYMETPIVFPPYKYAENHRFFLFHTWSSHPRRPGQAVLHPTTPTLHRAQLFTFAQGRGYKKATLPWGGLDGAQIPVVKNKTLRKAGPGAVCGLGDERHGRTGELRWENPALLCGPLWFCTSLMLGTGQKEGVRDVQCKSPCQGNKQDWRVMQAKEKGLAMDSRSGPAGAALGLPRLLPGEEKFLLNRIKSLRLYWKVVLIRHQDFQHKVLYMINFFWVSFISQKN